jgi:hypothetical protein
MRAKWGIAWLLPVVLLAIGLCNPLPGVAAVDGSWKASPSLALPPLPQLTETSLEAQMLGEKTGAPSPSSSSATALLRDAVPSVEVNPEGTATIKLPRNLEMNISFLYKRNQGATEPPRLADPGLLLKYSMDYRVLSNLRVGLNGYLFRPSEEGLLSSSFLSSREMGFGPELKYDLGRWSFLLRSQMATGTREHGEGLQNWFRVWYAF